MNNKRIFTKTLLILLVIITVFITACSEETNQTSKEAKPDKKIVNIGVSYPPSNINPLTPVGVVSTYVAELMFQPLIEVDEDMTFKPMLADSIETEDNITFTINLNKDAKWTDGEPVTADDVIFTIKLGCNPKAASDIAYEFRVIEGFDENGYIPDGVTDVEGVKKIDDHTLKLKAKHTLSTNIFNDAIARYLMPLPEHILKDIAPEDINKHPFFQKPDVTNGPFKLVNYNRDNYVELEANKDFFKGAPKIDQLNFKVMQSNEIVARLESGEIDMNLPSFGVIPIDDLEKVKSLSNISTVLAQPVANKYIYINQDVIPDARVRRAMVYGTNREKIVKDLLKGNGEVIDGYFTSYSPYFDEDLGITEYNPEKAKELLKEANWDSNKEIVVTVLAGDNTLEQAADIFAANLKEVGMNLKIQMVDIATLVNKRENSDYDAMIAQYSLTPIDPYPDMTYFLNEGNSINYNDEKVQTLMDEVSKEVDEDKIKEIYAKINKIASEEALMPSLYANRALGAVNKRLIGAEAKDYGTFIDVHNWDIKQ